MCFIISVDELSDCNGNVFAKAQMSVFVVGAGGYGGPRTSTKAVACEPMPKRKPDVLFEQKTSEDQAALYRQGVLSLFLVYAIFCVSPLFS